MSIRTIVKCCLLLEGLIQVGFQVFDILNADRQANQRIAYAQLCPFRRWHARMRHYRRVINQALYTAEALGKREHSATLEEAPRIFKTALDEKGDDAAKTRHLFPGEFVLRM